jgi:hypothetical protein
MSTTATRSPLTGGRLAAVIAGGLTLLLSATAALGAAGLTWASSKQDDAGYYTTSTETFATSTHAIATDDLDVDGVPGALGKIRVNVSSANGKPLFAGVARTRDVDAYLLGSAHETLTDIDVDPFEPTLEHAPGTGTPARPADQRFWVATSDGSKPLDWKVKDGTWSVVVMNADGSANVDARVSAGARLPWLDELEIAAWVAAALFLALGGGLLASGLRRRPQPSSPAGSASGA